MNYHFSTICIQRRLFKKISQGIDWIPVKIEQLDQDSFNLLEMTFLYLDTTMKIIELSCWTDLKPKSNSAMSLLPPGPGWLDPRKNVYLCINAVLVSFFIQIYLSTNFLSPKSHQIMVPGVAVLGSA